jgi:hypothetical protein
LPVARFPTGSRVRGSAGSVGTVRQAASQLDFSRVEWAHRYLVLWTDGGQSWEWEDDLHGAGGLEGPV